MDLFFILLGVQSLPFCKTSNIRESFRSDYYNYFYEREGSGIDVVKLGCIMAALTVLVGFPVGLVFCSCK